MRALAPPASQQRAGAPATRAELLWLRAGCASLWLTTALGVLHPYYRLVGHDWLQRLGAPDALMWLACAAELVLGLLVLALPPGRWLTLVQVAAVAGFTLVLAALDPWLLVHPFGMLSKNLPFVALVLAAHLAFTEGWSPRATAMLRWGMALPWITEGLFPKLLFQQQLELAVVERSGLVPFDAATFLAAMGAAQLASGLAAALLEGPMVRLLWAAQCAALVVLPLLVSWQDPLLWVHPFGPLTKNLPILCGTVLLLVRARR